jgi:hypothetical protein
MVGYNIPNTSGIVQNNTDATRLQRKGQGRQREAGRFLGARCRKKAADHSAPEAGAQRGWVDEAAIIIFAALMHENPDEFGSHAHSE